MIPRLEYSETADAVYIYLRDLPYAFGEDIDHERRVDYAGDNQPIGIELLNVSDGVNLDDLPDREIVEQLLKRHSIKVFA